MWVLRGPVFPVEHSKRRHGVAQCGSIWLARRVSAARPRLLNDRQCIMHFWPRRAVVRRKRAVYVAAAAALARDRSAVIRSDWFRPRRRQYKPRDQLGSPGPPTCLGCRIPACFAHIGRRNNCLVFERLSCWLRGPAVEHWSLADVLSLCCARLVADG